jgi:hypothetical protein
LIEGIPKRLQIDIRQRINQIIPAGNAHLNEAKFLRIRVQTVRLGVHGQPFGLAQGGQQRLKLIVVVNHARRVNRKNAPDVEPWALYGSLSYSQL